MANIPAGTTHHIEIDDAQVVVRTKEATVTVRLDNRYDYLVAVNRGDGAGPTQLISRKGPANLRPRKATGLRKKAVAR